MRVWLSGPRLFNGLLRPGVSFDLRGRRAVSRAPGASDFVYVIGSAQGRVKIGMSTDPVARLATLQTASPDRLWLALAAPAYGNAYAIEQEAHAILAAHRLAGEWFTAPPEMAIAAVYGAAGRLGVSLTSQPRPPEQGIFPRSTNGRIFLALLFLYALGLLMQGRSW